ncbi:MAG: hypothetical protein WCO78_00595 [Candidatus Roizmanbacteria bacterium]
MPNRLSVLKWLSRTIKLVLYTSSFVCAYFIIVTNLAPTFSDSDREALPFIIRFLLLPTLQDNAAITLIETAVLQLTFVCIVCTYFFVSLVLITQNKLLNHTYQTFKTALLLMIATTMPYIGILLFLNLSSYIISNASNYQFIDTILHFLSPTLFVLLMYIIEISIYALFQTVVDRISRKVLMVTYRCIGLLMLAATLFFMYFISSFFLPHPSLFVDISLNDPDGRYVINYDGDYWLTYYTDANKCFAAPESACVPSWIKAGNTSISDAPVSLKPFVDKIVRVGGEFTPIVNSIEPSDPAKQFCMNGRTCVHSPGPGTWYMSPLKIRTIELVK